MGRKNVQSVRGEVQNVRGNRANANGKVQSVREKCKI